MEHMHISADTPQQCESSPLSRMPVERAQSGKMCARSVFCGCSHKVSIQMCMQVVWGVYVWDHFVIFACTRCLHVRLPSGQMVCREVK